MPQSCQQSEDSPGRIAFRLGQQYRSSRATRGPNLPKPSPRRFIAGAVRINTRLDHGYEVSRLINSETGASNPAVSDGVRQPPARNVGYVKSDEQAASPDGLRSHRAHTPWYCDGELAESETGLNTKSTTCDELNSRRTSPNPFDSR